MQKTVLFRRAGIVSDRPEGVPFGRAMTSAGDPTGTLQALQVYKDGVVWFSTNAPYFNIATGLEAGTHRITAKGWDASGPYSTTIFVTSTGN